MLIILLITQKSLSKWRQTAKISKLKKIWGKRQRFGTKKEKAARSHLLLLSGKRDSNSRPQPWQGCALPTELFPQNGLQRYNNFLILQNFFAQSPYNPLNHRVELPQEAGIIFEIVAKVVHQPLKHGNTLNTHSESKT